MGKPLHSLSTRLISKLSAELGERIPIIGCRSPFVREWAGESDLPAGASLLQVLFRNDLPRTIINSNLSQTPSAEQLGIDF